MRHTNICGNGATGLVSIPDELNAVEAAPILCAGIATFNALKKSGAQAGGTVAILGIGGLGHMVLQYARRMGFQVIAIGRGSDSIPVKRVLPSSCRAWVVRRPS